MAEFSVSGPCQCRPDRHRPRLLTPAQLHVHLWPTCPRLARMKPRLNCPTTTMLAKSALLKSLSSSLSALWAGAAASSASASAAAARGPPCRPGKWVLRAALTVSSWQALQHCLCASAAAARGLPCRAMLRSAYKEWCFSHLGTPSQGQGLQHSQPQQQLHLKVICRTDRAVRAPQAGSAASMWKEAAALRCEQLRWAKPAMEC